MREMQDTQNNCLRMIPKDWEYPRLKYYCKISNGSDPQTEGQIPVYGSGKEIVKYCSEYKEGPAILLGRKGTLDKPRYVEGKFWNVDTAMDAYPINGINSKFLYFVTTILDIGRYATVTAKPSMTQSDYYNMPIPVPSVSEQEQIVRYIEEKTADIDEAISRQKEAIEKLEEYRKNYITSYIRKREGWTECKIKYIANIVRGGSPRPIEAYLTDEDGLNWIKIGDATGNGKYINSTKQKIIAAGLNKTRLVPAGTLLLTNSMSFGHPYILNVDGCIHDGWLAFFDFKEVTQSYLYYFLESDIAMMQFSQSVEGSVVNNLNIEKVRNAYIAFPSINEQETIVNTLDTMNSNVDEAIFKHKRIVEKLEEYKKSLIYNAVTGKIDCRN